MKPVDVCIVGGGVAGAAAAVALETRGFSVQLIEARPPAGWAAEQVDPRVYALSPASIALLARLGVWDSIAQRRAQPFREMRVWDTDGSICFTAQDYDLDVLGSIVEDVLLVDALWERLECAPLCPATVEAVDQDAQGVEITLTSGERVEAKLLVAADGAQSMIRRLAGIRTDSFDYGARAIVTHVRTERAHDNTCWQRFLPSGPVGLLPLNDGRLSVVWSADNATATNLLNADDAAFCHALADALDGKLGAVTEASKRLSFPLRRHHAQRYVADRVVLIGDAAHSIHPLAGQGLNIGLADVACLAELVEPADPGAAGPLRRYHRERRADNADMIAATDGLDRLFSNRNPALRLLRGSGLNTVDSVERVKALFVSVTQAGPPLFDVK